MILGFASAFLALVGFEVNCACYSRYLSERDYNAFSELFETLQLEDNIHYGTFNKLCERIINYHADIR